MANQRLLVASLLALMIAAPIIAKTQQPVAQGWSGWAHCQITIQGPGYSHSETHVWKVAGEPTRQGNMEISPMTWTVTGNGSLQRVSGPTTVSAQWTVNGTLQNVTVGATLHLDRITIQRWTNHGPARSALTGTEISTTNGAARSRVVVLDIQQWAFPSVETGTTSTRATGSNTVPFDGLRGPMNPPSGAIGTAACTWDFARGGASPSSPPPSAVTSPTTPSSGGTMTGGTGGSADVSVGVNLRAIPPYVAPANGKVLYDLAIWNNGPSAVAGTMLKVTAGAGPSNWTNFVCFSSQGAAPVPCPSGIAVATIQSGLALPNLPPNSGFKLWFDGAVPDTAGSNLSVTATVTPPTGVTDPKVADNSHTLAIPIVASTSSGGSSASTTQPVAATADLYSGLDSTIPLSADTGFQIPIRIGNRGPGAVNGAVVKVAAGAGLFIADVGCSIFYAGNSIRCFDTGSVTGAQAASGFAISNLPAANATLWVNGLVTATSGATVSVTVTIAPPTGVTDPTPGDNSYTQTATVVASQTGGGGAGGTNGGTTGVATTADLTSYIEATGPSNPQVSWPANGNATYDMKIRNSGPGAADGATIAVPASPGLRKWRANCSQYRGPSWDLTMAQIESGFVIPTFPAGDYVDCVISAAVTGTAGSVATMTVNVTAPGAVSDPDPGNNSATNTLPIR